MAARQPRLDVVRARMRDQRLIGPRFDTPQAAVAWLGAVQAQDYAGAKWALAQRCVGATDASLDALFDRGALLRTHVLRPTWHFVTPPDLRWMLALTAPRVKQAMASYDRKLALDDAVYARSHAALAKALHGGKHLTRDELARVLATAGIAASDQRLAHLMMRAELDAVICSGARRGKQHTYALLDERAPSAPPLPRADALAALTRRYFTSHGPAQLADFAWWSGLTLTDAKAGVASLAPDLDHATLDGKTWWFAASPAPLPRRRGPTLHLLPNYDEYLVAFKDHTPIFTATHFRGVDARDLLGIHLILHDGAIIGGWRRTLAKHAVTLDARLAAPLDPAARTALDQAVAAFGRFLGTPVDLTVRAARGRWRR